MKVTFSLLLLLPACLNAKLVHVTDPVPSGWHWQYQQANMMIERRAFSGGDAGGGFYWYWGGGHSSYSGSDLVVYDIAHSQWRRLTPQELWIEAETWPYIYRVESDGSLIKEQPISTESLERIKRALGGGSAVPFVTPRGQPGVTHSYQQVAYWPEKRALCMAHVSSGLWCYYQDVGEWHLLDRNAPVASIGINHHNLIHDSKRGTLMIIRGVRDRSVWRLESEVWVKLMELPSFGWGTVMLEHDPVRDLLVGTYGKKGWVKIDLTTETVSTIENMPAGVRALEWDPATEKFLVLSKQGVQSANPVSLYQYDPEANSFVELAPTGGPPVGWIRVDLFDYDPVNDVFLLPDIQVPGSNGPVQGMWILKRAAASSNFSVSP